MTTPEQIEKIREKYRAEFPSKSIMWDGNEAEYFSDDYVEWLEQQLAEASESNKIWEKRAEELAGYLRSIESRLNKPEGVNLPYENIPIAVKEQFSASEQKAREFAEWVDSLAVEVLDSYTAAKESYRSQIKDVQAKAQAYLTKTKGEQSNGNKQ